MHMHLSVCMSIFMLRKLLSLGERRNIHDMILGSVIPLIIQFNT